MNDIVSYVHNTYIKNNMYGISAHFNKLSFQVKMYKQSTCTVCYVLTIYGVARQSVF